MSPEHYPAIAHEHGNLRTELAAFGLVLDADDLPPPGHAFHDALAAAVHYFEHDLPAHVDEEEAIYYPRLAGLVSAALLARLREQHQAMLVMAGMFSRQHQIFAAAPTDEAWTELRHIGKRLVETVRRHLDFEEAVPSRAEHPLP
jgi:hypothetical protein